VHGIRVCHLCFLDRGEGYCGLWRPRELGDNLFISRPPPYSLEGMALNSGASSTWEAHHCVLMSHT